MIGAGDESRRDMFEDIEILSGEQIHHVESSRSTD
jgi:hypothetical protein